MMSVTSESAPCAIGTRDRWPPAPRPILIVMHPLHDIASSTPSARTCVRPATPDRGGRVPGEDAEEALGRGIWWPALHATKQAGPSRLGTLVRLLLLACDESVREVAEALPGCLIDDLVANEVITVDGLTARAALDIRPHADDNRDYLVVSDLDAATRTGPVLRDHVLGIGGASIIIGRAVIREPVASALDLGTGCGIQALHMDSHCERIVATDTNPRALALAAATARLCGMSWDLRAGSLFEPVAGERFDMIVSNPPFVGGFGRTGLHLPGLRYGRRPRVRTAHR